MLDKRKGLGAGGADIPLPNTLQCRAGNDTPCANCGKRLCPKRGSRWMRFCGVACRQCAFRARAPARVIVRELFDGLVWNPVTSVDGVVVLVARVGDVS